jgi:hypothetical protein
VSGTSTASALDRVEQQFQALTTSPRPLIIDGFAVGHGLPDGPVSLGEARDLLAVRTATPDLKDAVWSVLVRRAQADSDTWGVAAAGMMMRGLRGITARVSRGAECRRDDLQSEVLLGFYEALYGLDPDAPGIVGLLWWAAYRRGVAARRTEQDATGFHLLDSDVVRGRRISPPGGHPDLVLFKAVGDGVLNADEADLIGDTRVGGNALTVASERFGLSYAACHKRRFRAERRMARYLGRRVLGEHPGSTGRSSPPAAA